MRYCIILALLFLFGCKKDNNKTSNNVEPKCQLKSYSYLGYKYPLTYHEGKLVIVGEEPTSQYRLTYSNTGKLVRVEHKGSPATRTDLIYNDDGKVLLEINYDQISTGDWVEFLLSSYTYTNGKVVGISEEYRSLGQQFEKEVVWEGDNIRSIITRANNAVICNQKYSYDMSTKNPVAALNDFYYISFSRASYGMAMSTSANRLLKEEYTCSSTSPSTTNITYGFNSKGLIESISYNGDKFLTYTYDCL